VGPESANNAAATGAFVPGKLCDVFVDNWRVHGVVVSRWRVREPLSTFYVRRSHWKRVAYHRVYRTTAGRERRRMDVLWCNFDVHRARTRVKTRWYG
jgi:hypothetical protein